MIRFWILISLLNSFANELMSRLKPVNLSRFEKWTVWLCMCFLYALSYYVNEIRHLEEESRITREGISSQALVTYVKLGGTSIVYAFKVGSHTFEGQGNAEDVSVGSKISIVYVSSDPQINRQGDKLSNEAINEERNIIIPAALAGGIIVSSVFTYLLVIVVKVTIYMTATKS